MGRVNAGSSLASALEEESLSVSFFSREMSCSGGIKGEYDGAAARNIATTKRDIKECFPSCIFNL